MSTPPGEPDDSDLEDLLRRVPAPRPDPLRLEQARRAFLGAGREAGSRARGVGRMPGVVPIDDGERFAQWLARAAPAATPSKDFRRRARNDFLSLLAAVPLPRRTSRAFKGLVLALAAAAILALTFLLPGPDRWDVRLRGPVRFDGEDFGLGEDGRLARALESSGTLEATHDAARVSLSGKLEFELLGGGQLTFPTLPELDGVSTVALELRHGEAYVRTLAGYPGNPVLIHTPQAEVALHGTTVGVLVDAQGTCVCVADGTARVSSSRLAEGSRDVGPRSTLFVFEDGTMGVKSIDFPPDDDPEAGHTRDLVQFATAP